MTGPEDPDYDPAVEHAKWLDEQGEQEEYEASPYNGDDLDGGAHDEPPFADEPSDDIPDDYEPFYEPDNDSPEW